MSLVMTELSDDVPHAPDPSFNPKVFSEDEEEERNSLMEKNYSQLSSGGPSGVGAIPIAPMTPRREENRSRLLNSILSMADGNGNNFFRSPRFVYTNPSLLRERAELRKALVNNSKNHNGATASNSQEESGALSKRNNYQPYNSSIKNQSTARVENRNEAIEKPSSSSNKFQPSANNSDRNISNTYHQNDQVSVEHKLNNVSEMNSSSENQGVVDKEYSDFNLSEVIKFCENFKIGDVDTKRKAIVKARQEKTETSFLNSHGPLGKLNKTHNPQTSKTFTTPCTFSCDGNVPNHSNADSKIQNIQKVKNVLGKRLNQEKIGTENLKFIDENPDNLIDRMSRSCSVGYLDDVDTGLVPCELTLKLLQKGSPKRLVLVGGSRKKYPCKQPSKTKSVLKTCGKSRSLDSSELLISCKNNYSEQRGETDKKEKASALDVDVELPISLKIDETNDGDNVRKAKENQIGSLVDGNNESFPPPSPRLPRSQPVTPAMGKKKRNQSSSPIRQVN